MNDSTGINRRTAISRISAVAALCATPALRAAQAAEPAQQTGMGLVLYVSRLRREWLSKQKDNDTDLFDPHIFLQHCHKLGAGGMQARLGTMDASGIRALRDYADKHELFFDAIVNPPKNKDDAARFEAEIRVAAEAGAVAVRSVIMPGRRYERFKTLEEFKKFEAAGQAMLERAAPIVEKHRVRLAVENHKDQRIEERVALYKHLDCEYIGACVDTGNSFALLDDPYEAVEALTPYAFTVHLKDQAVREYDDGFLLGDIPLGQGCFDLNRMVAILRKAHPKIHFVLELITRDALKVPCLTPEYWATLADVPARDLAQALRIVREHPAKQLQDVSSLPLEGQVALEDANVAASIKYAGEQLGL